MTGRIRLAVAAAMLAAVAPACAQTSAETTANLAIVAEHQIWAEEQARWQAERQAAARRLISLADILRDPQSSLNEHGRDVRGHGSAIKAGTATAGFARRHADLRADHAEERVAHHDIIDDIDTLDREIRKEQARSAVDRVKAVGER